MAERPDPEKFILVETTLPTIPLPSSDSRSKILTERLILRALEASDLENVHAVRRQEDVMTWTSEGRIDADLAESQYKLAQFLPPNNAVTMFYAICSRETGQFLGMGGLVALEANLGWPAVSYIFDQETWGKGYATEFLRAFLDMYRKLPRSKVQIRIDARSVVDSKNVEERIVANTVGHNDKSQKVLEKCGFKCALEWQGRRCPMSTFQYLISSNPATHD